MQPKLPIVSVNGVIDAQVSPLDRGFTYGDGVFETCSLQNRKIPLWNLHRDRLQASCKSLLLLVDMALVEAHLESLIRYAEVSDAVIKVTLTRGQGGRGYRLPEQPSATIVIGIFPVASYPETYFSQGVAVRLCQLRLGRNPQLAGLKHLNRLEQVLARAEWQDNSIAEGLLLDTEGNLVEGVFSNLFWIKDGRLFTPDLSQAGVAGVMRRFIIDTLAPSLQLQVGIGTFVLEDLLVADEIFLCNSLYGVWPVQKIVNLPELVLQAGSITLKLQAALHKLLASSTES